MLKVVKPGWVQTDQPRQMSITGVGTIPARDLETGMVHAKGWTIESVTKNAGMVSATGTKPDGTRFALHVKETKEVPVR